MCYSKDHHRDVGVLAYQFLCLESPAKHRYPKKSQPVVQNRSESQLVPQQVRPIQELPQHLEKVSSAQQ